MPAGITSEASIRYKDEDKMLNAIDDVDNIYISQPDNGEQALEITETMVRSGAIDIVVVDSVAALVPKESAASSAFNLSSFSISHTPF